MRIHPVLVVLALGASPLAGPAHAAWPLAVHKSSTLPERALGGFQNSLLSRAIPS